MTGLASLDISWVFCVECGRRLIVQDTRTKTGRVYNTSSATAAATLSAGDAKPGQPPRSSNESKPCTARSICPPPDQRERIEHVVLATLHRQQAENNERPEDIAEGHKQKS